MTPTRLDEGEDLDPVLIHEVTRQLRLASA